MKIYVASSWRNQQQPEIVDVLRQAGHDVYDFKNPNGGTGFQWSAIDPEWQTWNTDQYAAALRHPIAQRGYASDIGALRDCDLCVLVLPAGRSASWEFGYAMGQGKRGIVYHPDGEEPELMFSAAIIVAEIGALLDALEKEGA